MIFAERSRRNTVFRFPGRVLRMRFFMGCPKRNGNCVFDFSFVFSVLRIRIRISVPYFGLLEKGLHIACLSYTPCFKNKSFPPANPHESAILWGGRFLLFFSCLKCFGFVCQSATWQCESAKQRPILHCGKNMFWGSMLLIKICVFGVWALSIPIRACLSWCFGRNCGSLESALKPLSHRCGP